MSGNYYRAGDWRVICDDCGSKRFASDTAKKWNGMIVCRDTCFEIRNPQDFVRGVADNQTVPFTRPEPADVFLEVNEVTADDL